LTGSLALTGAPVVVYFIGFAATTLGKC
jgi:hypothetical protein